MLGNQEYGEQRSARFEPRQQVTGDGGRGANRVRSVQRMITESKRDVDDLLTRSAMVWSYYEQEVV